MKDQFVLLAQKIDAGSVNIPTATADNILGNILNLVYFIAGLVAVVVIIVSGLMMTVQGNDPGKIAKRKQMITYGIVGLIVILLAFVITRFVIGIGSDF